MKRLFALAGLATVVCGCIGGCARNTHAEAAVHGAEHIQFYGCASCHTIPGIPGARGRVGPPLDGIGSRTYIAGVLPNSPNNLSRWIQHPHQVHPGTAMPEMGVTPSDAAEITRYLEDLR